MTKHMARVMNHTAHLMKHVDEAKATPHFASLLDFSFVLTV